MAAEQLDADEFTLDATGDPGLVNRCQHVDLEANAKLAGQINTGLYREAGVRQDGSLVMRLEVVQVGASAMRRPVRQRRNVAG